MSISPASPRQLDWPEWRRVPPRRMGASVRTTVSLDADLLDAVDREVDRGNARTRTEFLNAAILTELRRRQREAVNAGFRAMALDLEGLAEAAQIEAEFAGADAETAAMIDAEFGPYEE
jgi:metal-responsive CopG/Arc/MetJ family transcriptional regulator